MSDVNHLESCVLILCFSTSVSVSLSSGLPLLADIHTDVIVIEVMISVSVPTLGGGGC